MSGESELDDASEVDGVDGPPTVVPAFDPTQYAEESEIRERMPTLTDESLLEQARLKSLPTSFPPPRPPIATVVPGPNTGPRDSLVEIDVGESDIDIDALGETDQVEILRTQLAPLSRVPALARPLGEIGPALEDPRAAYVLSFVDGILPLDTIIDVTGLPELDTLRVLDRVVSLGLVTFRSRSRG